MPMGYASCLEDNIDKVYDNKYMRGNYDPRPERLSWLPRRCSPS
jgi:hypothetical protein